MNPGIVVSSIGAVIFFLATILVYDFQERGATNGLLLVVIFLLTAILCK